MLFNSPQFLFFFLPATLAAYALLGRTRFAGMAVLLGASAFFYEQWSFRYLLMLIGLMSANYLLGKSLLRKSSRPLLTAGVTLNLAVLGYFKYYNFFAEQISDILGSSLATTNVILPLGISFFVFQKIAYLVDCYRREVPEHSYFSFSLFVLFFPQLIAGPITHAREIVPQFAALPTRLSLRNLAIGLTIFTIGLCKKMLLADNIGVLVSEVFDHANTTSPTLIVAWLGAIGFGLQIYFDFSGYSDMAIGLAYMFGIRLPVNFASPYKSLSITEFWRRWHITLSRFLREYLYIPLGGNRHGPARQYINLILTMGLGGLWHGAGWTFILWGVLHGVCLAVHKLWCDFSPVRLPQRVALILTFAIVMLLWVPFRAPTMTAAISMWDGMFGLNGIALPSNLARVPGADMLASLIDLNGPRLDLFAMVVWIPVGMAVVLFAPNTQYIMRNYTTGFTDGLSEVPSKHNIGPATWRPTMMFGMVVGFGMAACILKFNDISQFIYFQF